MESRKILVLVGITLSVIPSTLCIAGAGAFNLSSLETITQAIIVVLPSMIAMGALIGLGGSFIQSNIWLVAIGAMLGWIVGLLASAMAFAAFGLPQYQLFILLVSVGVLAGLLPSLIVRILKRPR